MSLVHYFLSPLGAHVHSLLQQPSRWRLLAGAIAHDSGISLRMSRSEFDVADDGYSDFITELSWLDRIILWPMAKRIRHQLKYPGLQ